MQPLNVIVAADSALLRAGLTHLLTDHGITVVAQAVDGAELKRKARAHRPDMAVVALKEPPVREDLPLLVLAHAPDPDVALDLLDDRPAGAGYLLEERIPDVGRFIGAVREVAAGGSVLDPAVVPEVLGRRTARDAFTAREREVLGLMAQGRSNRAIAQAAFLSERAVERHVTAIFDKLRLPPSSRTHRRVLAVRAHLQC
ncbi:response regulator transcription factor [Solirubrobacter sp. CPCC 204708]|uniref:Response regulator transcription factor n=1 Tax=Solirubrobacter deserti TaxID=2282478 RepID=A0ABT4RTU6_9ACTN|nr:response regulator transcription factor [Solirubrobacter deserti]MBE2318687.1 response regulator transcription factor [Solirubrobacter deserti]MDA0142002.1 response regulator transcription factor [Solirubrobacter deserti]